MDQLGVYQVIIMAGLVVLKVVAIVGTILYVRYRSERKKRRFINQEAERRMNQPAGYTSDHSPQ